MKGAAHWLRCGCSWEYHRFATSFRWFSVVKVILEHFVSSRRFGLGFMSLIGSIILIIGLQYFLWSILFCALAHFLPHLSHAYDASLGRPFLGGQTGLGAYLGLRPTLISHS